MIATAENPPTAETVGALPEPLSLEQAAWLLQITPGRLHAAAKRGEVPARAMGSQRIRYVFSKSALLGWLQSP